MGDMDARMLLKGKSSKFHRNETQRLNIVEGNAKDKGRDREVYGAPKR